MDAAAQFLQDLAVITIAAALAGLACKRAGLSPVAGYLVAGMLVGPHTPPSALVTDAGRVQTLAQLGLVFLMFGIGLGFSLRRMRQLGPSVVFASAGTAFLVFNLARLCAGGLGLDRAGTVFFAGMVVSSSSALIGKILVDTGRAHEKSSQLALGITLSEDIAAIVMLTLLGSYVQFGPEAAPVEGAAVVEKVALFGGFALVLGVGGLLVVPRVLRRLAREASTELETVFVAGLLFGLSLMVVRAGYSLALGAFMLGTIVGETPQRAHVERAFAGLRDFFSAIFFVAVGMTIEVARLGEAVAPLAVLVAIAVIGRPLAAGAVLLALGFDKRTAVSAGLVLAPLGEFGFITAQLGTAAGLLPPEHLSAVVGASLATAVAAPVLVRHNHAIADRAARLRLPLADRLLVLHGRIVEAFQRQRESSLLWRLLRKRLAQTGVEVALITMALVFAQPAIGWVVAEAGPGAVPYLGTGAACWAAIGLVLLAPFVAVWRNVEAVAMITADYVGMHGPAFARLRPLVTAFMQGGAMIALVLWWWNFVPVEAAPWLSVGVLAFLAAAAAILWRRLIRWHAHLEIAFEAAVAAPEASPFLDYAWMDRHAPWGLQIGEIALPDRFAAAGRSIGELGIRKRFGCSVIGIERQGFQVANPGPASHLFPGDRVLLLGTEAQIAAARGALLADPAGGDAPEDTFRDLAVELVEVPAGSDIAGRTLADLNWPRLVGVQVVGHERAGARQITPAADLELAAGDRLLVLGTPRQVEAVRAALAREAPRAAPSGIGEDGRGGLL
jgi:CPA2 family monovalent cation:H+ antiporter-2